MRYCLKIAWIVFLLFWPLVSCADDYRVKFGIMEESSGGEIAIIEETFEIPLKTKETGFVFGYTITAKDDKPFSTYAMHILPKEPKLIGGTISGDMFRPDGIRTPKETHRQFAAFPIYLDKGDPAGKYRIKIYINDSFFKEISYDVMPVEKKKALSSQCRNQVDSAPLQIPDFVVSGTRIFYKGQELRLLSDIKEWEKVLGKTSREGIWEHLGIDVTIERQHNLSSGTKPVNGLVVLLIRFNGSNYTGELYDGDISIDGFVLNQETTRRDIVSSSVGQRFKQDYLRTIYSYTVDHHYLRLDLTEEKKVGRFSISITRFNKRYKEILKSH